MRSFKQYLKKQLRDGEFAHEYRKVSEDVDFALTLTRRREELGLTQTQLAERTGVKQPMIARIEGGQIPTVPTLHRMAAALDARVVITGEIMFLEPIDQKEGDGVAAVTAKFYHTAAHDPAVWQSDGYSWYSGESAFRSEGIFRMTAAAPAVAGVRALPATLTLSDRALDDEALYSAWKGLAGDILEVSPERHIGESLFARLRTPTDAPLGGGLQVITCGPAPGREVRGSLSQREEKSDADLALAA